MRIRVLALALLLPACGGKSDDPVVLLQQDRDPASRAAAVQRIVEGGPGQDRLWRRLLEDPDPEIARLAAAAVGRAAGKDGWEEPPDALLEALLAAAARKEPDVRSEAIASVGLLWAGEALVPPKVAPFLADPDPRVRRAAIRAFRAFGPSTGGLDLAPLRASPKGDAALEFEAALALAACGDGSAAGIDRLVAAAADPADPARALEAVRALGRLGPRGAVAAPRLAAALPGAPEALASDIAQALGNLGDASPAVVAALEKAAGHRWEALRLQASLSLARLGKAGPAAEAVLRAVLAQRAARPRVHAAEGLALLGKEGPAPTDLLGATLADATADRTTRALAAEALGRLAMAKRPLSPAATDALRKAAKDPVPEVRRAALRAAAAGN